MGSVLNKTTKQYLPSVSTSLYDPAEWAINPTGAEALVAAGIPTDEWMLEGNSVREMTTAEKDATLLGSRKLSRMKALKASVTAFVDTYYDVGQQMLIAALWTEGQDKLWVNRKALCQGIMDWINSVMAEFYTRKNAVVAATTLASVAAVSADFSSFAASAPSMTVEDIKNTVN